MTVRFLKETVVYKGLKPYKEGQTAQFTEKEAMALLEKGFIEIIGEVKLQAPKKEKKKKEVKIEKEN
jgi:hypothetical protein